MKPVPVPQSHWATQNRAAIQGAPSCFLSTHLFQGWVVISHWASPELQKKTPQETKSKMSPKNLSWVGKPPTPWSGSKQPLMVSNSLKSKLTNLRPRGGKSLGCLDSSFLFEDLSLCESDLGAICRSRKTTFTPTTSPDHTEYIRVMAILTQYKVPDIYTTNTHSRKCKEPSTTFGSWTKILEVLLPWQIPSLITSYKKHLLKPLKDVIMTSPWPALLVSEKGRTWVNLERQNCLKQLLHYVAALGPENPPLEMGSFGQGIMPGIKSACNTPRSINILKPSTGLSGARGLNATTVIKPNFESTQIR